MTEADQEVQLTHRQHEVLNLIAQGDEVILRLAPRIVNELRSGGFIVKDPDGYELTPKGSIALLERKGE